MRPTAGRWVSGEDFFDREGELRVLESHVADHNHLLVTGQRRMGKTSIARELGRRLERRGWILLGPFGQIDLVHYETRLQDGLEDETFSIAMEILADAATQDVFTPSARSCLERQYDALVEDIGGRVADAIEVLVHDGYLADGDDGYRFPSRLLRDWFAARFRDHHVPLESRCPKPARMG